MRKHLNARIARLEARVGIGQPSALLVIAQNYRSDDDVIGCGQMWDSPVNRHSRESFAELTERARRILNTSVLVLHYRPEFLDALMGADRA